MLPARQLDASFTDFGAEANGEPVDEHDRTGLTGLVIEYKQPSTRDPDAIITQIAEALALCLRRV
jgi:hypothetical protein